MTDDESEEPTKAQLWNRIKQLEQAVYPNRREILKAGVAAAAGGAAVASSGSASAGSASTGQVGTQSDPVDAYVEDFYDHNGNQPLSLPGDGTVNVTSVDAEQATINEIVGRLGWADNGTAQNVSSGSEAKVNWTNQEKEDSGIVTVSTADDEITVLEPGEYRISSFVTWTGAFAASGNVQIRIKVNGSVEKKSQREASTAENFVSRVTADLELSDNDTISIFVEQFSGNTESLSQDFSTASQNSQFTVKRTG